MLVKGATDAIHWGSDSLFWITQAATFLRNIDSTFNRLHAFTITIDIIKVLDNIKIQWTHQPKTNVSIFHGINWKLDRTQHKMVDICLHPPLTLATAFWFENIIWISGLRHHHVMDMVFPYHYCQGDSCKYNSWVFSVGKICAQIRKINPLWPKCNQF